VTVPCATLGDETGGEGREGDEGDGGADRCEDGADEAAERDEGDNPEPLELPGPVAVAVAEAGPDGDPAPEAAP